MTSRIRFLILVLQFGAAGVPSFAHHSFAADYDASKPVLLRGTVTRVAWVNPHVRFYIDVKDEFGRVTNWDFELGSPNTLMRSGWTRNSLKIGEEITVKGCRAKDSATQGNATTILSSDGKVLLAGQDLFGDGHAHELSILRPPAMRSWAPCGGSSPAGTAGRDVRCPDDRWWFHSNRPRARRQDTVVIFIRPGRLAAPGG